jgi:hypothetical protein
MNQPSSERPSDASPLGRVPARPARWSVQSAARTLQHLPAAVRDAIGAAYKARRGTFSGAWDRGAKLAMSEAIFHGAENDLEHEAVQNYPPNRAKLVVVSDLRARRNALLDATGENELRGRAA